MIWKTLLSFWLAAFLIGCAFHVERQDLSPGAFNELSRYSYDRIKASSPFLKAHMKNGNLYVFTSWRSESAKSIVAGRATLYNPIRDSLGAGQYSIGLDSVALLETNVITQSGSGIALTVFTGITVGVGILCAANPKACFGSCPTFYVSDGDSLRLQAEGFSSSILPSLEATDVDALYSARATNGELTVEMRNEALETHVVRFVNLLAVPRRSGCRAFYGVDGQFWECTALRAPLTAEGPEGDCRLAVSTVDGVERFSLADGNYLGAKEAIDLNFQTVPGRSYGLVVRCRQSLLPTYLLYQAYAYMGHDAGHWLAEIERGKVAGCGSELEGLIGGIEAKVLGSDGQWRLMGAINEHGPLAPDIHLIPVGAGQDTSLKVRLQMTKGAWRIDYIGLAELCRPLKPIRVQPGVVLRDARPDERALALLLDTVKSLVTFPGDTYTLKYKLPDANAEYELFLESRGYYLEWIRQQWIEEQSPLLLAEMMLAPENALRRLAPEFKRVEPHMEECFWRSRYAKQ